MHYVVHSTLSNVLCKATLLMIDQETKRQLWLILSPMVNVRTYSQKDAPSPLCRYSAVTVPASPQYISAQFCTMNQWVRHRSPLLLECQPTYRIYALGRRFLLFHGWILLTGRKRTDGRALGKPTECGQSLQQQQISRYSQNLRLIQALQRTISTPRNDDFRTRPIRIENRGGSCVE
jgi:hypothetical protein